MYQINPTKFFLFKLFVNTYRCKECGKSIYRLEKSQENLCTRSTQPHHEFGWIVFFFFFFLIIFFFLSIKTKYIQQLITMLLKIKLIKQDNAGHLFYFFNKQNKNKNTHTYTQKKDKKRKRGEITCSRPPPFSF